MITTITDSTFGSDTAFLQAVRSVRFRLCYTKADPVYSQANHGFLIEHGRVNHSSPCSHFTFLGLYTNILVIYLKIKICIVALYKEHSLLRDFPVLKDIGNSIRASIRVWNNWATAERPLILKATSVTGKGSWAAPELITVNPRAKSCPHWYSLQAHCCGFRDQHGQDYLLDY